MKNRKAEPLELYIHIPFCVKKCDYCDFLSASAGPELRRDYVQALLREIRGLGNTEIREVTTVFLGGGTPSLLEGEEIEEIFSALREKFRFSEKAEVTMEANPGTLTRKMLECCRKAGVNRLSLGLQSTHNRELRSLGRIHSFADFQESFFQAREAGFSNINLDLMFAIPGQTRESWNRSLRTAAELGPEHISAYSLIIEEGTPFAQRRLELPDEDTEYEMYEDTAEILGDYGYRQYEISNYAREGFACRHNIGYWKRTQYLGLGLGSASLLSGELMNCLDGKKREEGQAGAAEEYRWKHTESMEEYLRDSHRQELLRREKTVLTEKNRQEEFMFLGLRMTEGISQREFQNCFGVSLDEVYGKVLTKYEGMGLMEKNGDFWRFTRRGIHVSNGILADFLQD